MDTPTTPSTENPTSPSLSTSSPPSSTESSTPPLPSKKPQPLCGGLQEIVFSKAPEPESVTIYDHLYGETTIHDKVIVELLKSPVVQRLGSISQHGVRDHLVREWRISRLEHSVGAMLLVRRLGATISEQVAALLHDISHTVFSHDIDWAVWNDGNGPIKGSYHEVYKKKFLEDVGKDLDDILAKPEHGLAGDDVYNEKDYPLVELASPDLCADRLDYGLRDSVVFGTLNKEDAQSIYADLTVYPDISSPERQMVLKSQHLAYKFGMAYNASDEKVWGNADSNVASHRMGEVIKKMIDRGVVVEKELWSLTEHEFWDEMWIRANGDEKAILKDILDLEPHGRKVTERPSMFDGNELKIRTVDPRVWDLESGRVEPLSINHKEYKTRKDGRHPKGAKTGSNSCHSAENKMAE